MRDQRNVTGNSDTLYWNNIRVWMRFLHEEGNEREDPEDSEWFCGWCHGGRFNLEPADPGH